MSDARSGTSGAGSRAGAAGTEQRGSGSGEFQASVVRLEKAVSELVSTASERATTLIDETAKRLERELDRRQQEPTAPDAPESPRGKRRRRRHRLHAGDNGDDGHYRHSGYRSRLFACAGHSSEGPPRRLYRDPSREKIGGVCAGIARYYGMEPWVVRCIAVTGLLFFPTLVFPAYWVAYFVMDKPPKSDRRLPPDEGPRGRNDHRSPAPELGPRLSPRYSLRNVQADLSEVELRLRRMETHVTSGQYELQRELNKIDGGDDGRRG